MAERIRITDESVANIKVAKSATIVSVKGGYHVNVKNEYGSATLKDGSGEAVYPTKASARGVVHRHNSAVEFETPETLPSPSMRPPPQS